MYQPIRTGTAALCAGLMLLLAGCASNPMVQNIQGSSVPSGTTLSEVYDAIVEGGTIHGNYNKWVQNLDGDIQRALVY